MVQRLFSCKKLSLFKKKPENLNTDSKFIIVNLSEIDQSTILKPKLNICIKKKYEEKFEKAAKKDKIFTLHGGYPQIRQLLIKRGWIEKLSPQLKPNIQSLPNEILLGLIRPGNIYETVAISKLAKNLTPKFIWQSRHHNIKPLVSAYHNCINRSDNLNFTTKHGINNCIENSYWHTVKGLSEVLAPRFHCISNPDEYLAFLRDYRTTYCCSLIKFLSDNNPNDLFSINGDIPLSTIEYALNRIRAEIIIRKTTTDLNISIKKNPFGDESSDQLNWNKFFSSVNLLIKKEAKIRLLDSSLKMNIHYMCKKLIDNFKKVWPLLTSEGYNNLWILKPGYSSRGRGIYIKNNFHEIINYVNRHPLKKYILQKYIEEPLLIYDTKFDIRQHILLTIVNNRFNIWLYKDCYLRFCSQIYKLDNLDESIHLTNRSIQKKYKNCKRNSNLPINNMWLLKDFKFYLKSIKKSDIWINKIYPGIKKNIIGVVMASIDETDLVDNKFDLYGCDFMLNKFYETILIEINSSPDMLPTTKVTKKLCSAVLNDLIKVVVDLPNNKNADIGKFELIYSIDLRTWTKRKGTNNNKCNNNNNSKNNVNISVVGKTLNITKPNNGFNILPSELQSSITTKTNNNNKNTNTNIPSYLKNYRKSTICEN